MYPWMFFHDILMLDAEKSPEISAGSAGSPVGSRAQAMRDPEPGDFHDTIYILQYGKKYIYIYVSS